MKSPLLIAAFSLCLAAPLLAQSDDTTTTTPPKGHGHGHCHGGPGGLTQDERTELKTAHDSAVQADPSLTTEGKKLHSEMRDYMKKMHDAMVKADPNVEPILAKMKGHHHHEGPPPADDDSTQ